MVNLKKRLETGLQEYGYILAITPILLYWVYWTLNPSYWFNTDPQASYFLDSLSVFTGRPYVFINNPGTPVSLLGTGLMALTYPFFGSHQAFISYYIARPETFFTLADLFLLAINLITAIVLYKTAATTLEENKTLGAIALTVTFFAIHPHGFSTLTYWSHNSFNILGTLWLLWVFRDFSKGRELSWKKLLAWGFTAGVLSMTQMYLLAWPVSGVIFVFLYSVRQGKPLRQTVIASAQILFGSILGVLAMLAPIYQEFPRFWDWFIKIMTHQGVYGTGVSGIYSLETIGLSLTFWWQYLALMLLTLAMILLLLGAVVYFSRRLLIKIPPGHFAMAAGLLIQVFMLMLVFSKLYSRLRYVLAVAAVLPVLLLVTMKLLEMTPWRRIWFKQAIYILLLVSVCISLPEELIAQQKRAFVSQDAALARSLVVTHLAQLKHVPEKDIVVVYAFGTPTKCAGLLTAYNWVSNFDKEMATTCPNQYTIYDIPQSEQMNFPRDLPTLHDIAWDVVIWPGTSSKTPLYLDAVGALNIPKSWGIARAKWFYIRADKP